MLRINHAEILAHVQDNTPIVCIDVRESYRIKTFDAGGLKIQYNLVAKYEDLLRMYLTPGRIVVVCCFNDPSARVIKAANAIREMGFEDVRVLEKGLWHGWYMKVGAKVKLPFKI